MIQYIGGTCENSRARYIKWWFETESKNKIDKDYFTYIAIYEKKQLIGVVIFINCTSNNIDVHVHVPGNMSKRTLKEIFSYAFRDLNLGRLTVELPRFKKPMVKFLNAIGFIEEAVIKNYYGLTSEYDKLIYVMTKEQAQRWLN